MPASVSKNPEAAELVPVSTTFTFDALCATLAGTQLVGSAGSGASSLTTLTAQELVALQFSAKPHSVWSSAGSTHMQAMSPQRCVLDPCAL